MFGEDPKEAAAYYLGQKEPVVVAEYHAQAQWMPNEHPCQAPVFLVDRREPGGGYMSVCRKKDPEKPMAFRGEDWCCENHRKLLEEQRASQR